MMRRNVHKLLAFTTSVVLFFLTTAEGFAKIQSGNKQQRRASVRAPQKPPQHRRAPELKQEASEGGYIFAGPDGDFTIRLPSEPKREEDEAGTVGTIRRYSSTTGNAYFGVAYQDVGPAAGRLKTTHEETVSALLQREGNKIVSARRLSSNISQVELWSPSGRPGEMFHRIDRTVVIHDRMYTLGCGSLIAGQEVDKAMCRRFFASFRITGAPR